MAHTNLPHLLAQQNIQPLIKQENQQSKHHQGHCIKMLKMAWAVLRMEQKRHTKTSLKIDITWTNNKKLEDPKTPGIEHGAGASKDEYVRGRWPTCCLGAHVMERAH